MSLISFPQRNSHFKFQTQRVSLTVTLSLIAIIIPCIMYSCMSVAHLAWLMASGSVSLFTVEYWLYCCIVNQSRVNAMSHLASVSHVCVSLCVCRWKKWMLTSHGQTRADINPKCDYICKKKCILFLALNNSIMLIPNA